MALQKINGSMIGEVDDPRSGFQLIRRAWIHRYLRDKGIAYNPKLAMQHLISICEVREITPEMIARHVSGPAAINPAVNAQEQKIEQLERLIKAMAAAGNIDIDTLDLSDKTVPNEPMDYRDMDMASIRKMAKTLGVVAERTDSKDQLIEKIEAHGKDTIELDERSPEAESATEAGRAFRVSV